MSALSLFHDYTFQVVALGAALLGMTSGLIGSFAVLRRESLLGDVVSHAALPGIAAAFLLTGTKDTVWLLVGALCSGLAATGFILGVVRYSRIRFDTALALGMSVFFGLGLVLLTSMQKIPNSNQAGLQRFIFGQAAVLLRGDILVIAVTGAVLLALTLLFWKELKLLSFDPEFARSLGLPTRALNALLSAMTVAAIIAGLQTVGVILMSAMLVAPAEGKVILDGIDAAQLDESGRQRFRAEKIGLIFQQFHLIPYLTALENVMLAQHYHSVIDEEAAHEVLRQVGLEHRTDHRPSQLSGGEQQRVCIARALVNQPPVIFADEPTGNLDESNERLVLDLLIRLNRQGRTIVMVTHNPDLGKLTDRIIYLQHGKFQKEERHAIRTA